MWNDVPKRRRVAGFMLAAVNLKSVSSIAVPAALPDVAAGGDLLFHNPGPCLRPPFSSRQFSGRVNVSERAINQGYWFQYLRGYDGAMRDDCVAEPYCFLPQCEEANGFKHGNAANRPAKKNFCVIKKKKKKEKGKTGRRRSVRDV